MPDEIIYATVTTVDTPPAEPAPKALRGFALLPPEQRSEIARMGGKKAWENGTAHRFTAEEAKAAGQKGGQVVSEDSEWMSSIGKKGALARKLKRESER